MTPYYDDGRCTIYHGDCREDDSWLFYSDIVLTDPPFGIAYESGSERREGNARSIVGDESVELRDSVVRRLLGRPALIFGSPRAPEPQGVRARLIWDQMGALGMGDLSLPWKPSWSYIFVLGGPWAGTRDCGSVLRCAPVQSVARRHPHEKPVALLGSLLDKAIEGAVADPFMGSGSTLVAAKSRGRRAIGFEIDERYCEIAARRLGQEVLALG